MALKITCPHCGTEHRVREPYPLPGAELHCQCGRTLAITYPKGLVARLRGRGALFEHGKDDEDTDVFARAPHGPPPDELPPRPPIDPTVPLHPPPEPTARIVPPPPPDLTARTTIEPRSRPPTTSEITAIKPQPQHDRTPPPSKPKEPMAKAGPAPRAPRPEPRAPKRRRSWVVRALQLAIVLVVLGTVLGAATVAGVLWYFSQDLPTFETLADYQPPTVTQVYDSKGRLLGEIYEKRRYVIPLEEIPEHVTNAFVAAEDANFWTHPGVDAGGIVRAILRNAAQGKKAQGASTITQQVARNFLLTNEKKWSRKIKEMILATRMEEAFDKKHILYLYMNQIYLGSGAYGVEAAARTYFDKPAKDLTLAEAAIIAGLPQRPTDYSPLIHWDKARARQEYVLGQMLDKGFIDQNTYDKALAEEVVVHQGENEFLLQAPYFTEHIRRYLVDTYGFDKIYNDGLRVDSTCDLDLQKVAQQAVVDGVIEADHHVGWRGPLEHIADSAIPTRTAEIEKALKEAASHRRLRIAEQTSGRGGFDPLPSEVTLEVGARYDAVVVDVAEKHAIVAIGAHQAIIPLSWTTWGYEPNPKRNFKGRAQTDMNSVLKKGDVIQVTLEAEDAHALDKFAGYDAMPSGALAAAKLYQAPELEGAMLSFRLSDGAVLAMVGGVDYEDSEYNRATQAKRQVGSTFKPIVYAAAIGSRMFTPGSIIQDAPTVYNVLDGELWKPDNYGNEYLGNITLRRALQQSRNVCTIRVLDKLGLDPVFNLAGPLLRIGYDQPACTRTHIKESAECAGTSSESTVKGMKWCEACDPNSCPLTIADNPFTKVSCDDAARDVSGTQYCHSCDIDLRLCDWLKREDMPSGDNCVDQRVDAQGQVWCRSCDLSMGLGSSSLTMVELARAYSAFATYGHLVEPHWIDRVVDRDGTVIEEWTKPESWPEVMSPSVAGIANWMLHEVATGGTAAKSNQLGLHVAGKTGTTNDFFDAWFVGYNPDVLAAVWVGYDKPRSMGYSFTGGETALPIWMDFMKAAVPKDKNPDFPPIPGVEMVPIDESTGQVARGGRPMPMLPGTAPDNVVGEVGQKTAEDLLMSGF